MKGNGKNRECHKTATVNRGDFAYFLLCLKNYHMIEFAIVSFV